MRTARELPNDFVVKNPTVVQISHDSPNGLRLDNVLKKLCEPVQRFFPQCKREVTFVRIDNTTTCPQCNFVRATTGRRRAAHGETSDVDNPSLISRFIRAKAYKQINEQSA